MLIQAQEKPAQLSGFEIFLQLCVLTPEELFRNRDKGLLMLKSQVIDIETKFPLRPNK